MDHHHPSEEEFEALLAEEEEMMKEMEASQSSPGFDEEEATLIAASLPPSRKRSLDFSSPVRAPLPSQTRLEEIPESIDIADTRKRTLEEEADRVLLELDNILKDRLSNRNKRHKPLLPEVGLAFRDPTFDLAEHESDLALIDRIVAIRKTKESTSHTNKIVTPLPYWNNHVVIHRRVPDTEFQAVTTETGQRFYLTCQEEEKWDHTIAAVASSKHISGLLGTSYQDLKAQATREQIRLDALQAKRLAQEDDSGLESGAEEECTNIEELWVEKFKPRQYLHLLSDESTNRTVLQWIKLWDKVVFNRDLKRTKKNAKNKTTVPNKDRQNKFQKKPEVVSELDENNRPVQKVLLLCGPPGLGKTTLAHITAAHAGYNVVEINASDDNSVEIFRNRLENATSMQAVLGPNPRPNCLVIDEIDGAPAPSINILVNMLNGKDIGKKKRKLKAPILLQRPVICICNELYTPALRPLRQMALVVKFPPTHTPKLAQRLLEITQRQHLRADLSVLMMLCEKTENDIRSCLSILQFVRSNKKKLSMVDISGISVGQKDYQRSLFKIWQEIFYIPRQKKLRHNPLQETHESLIPMPDLDGDLNFEENNLAFRFQRILKTAQHAPYERVLQGWFENYLSLRDFILMETINIGLEWTLFTDLQLKEIMHSQAWTLMAYLPYTIVSHHLHFASLHWPNIQFPTVIHENNQKLTKNINLLSSMVSEMSPMARMFNSNKQLVLDVLPFLIHIIQPTLRQVSSQLYSSKEQQELNNLVNTMISYNLTYTQEKDPHGMYHFHLDPNVEEIVHFGNEAPKQYSYYSRQLISREVELEKMRRAEAYFEQVSERQTKATTAPASRSRHKSASTSLPAPASPHTPAVPNHKQTLHPREGETEAFKEEKAEVAKDFFGRIIKNKEGKKSGDLRDTSQSHIWFQFNEGFCNAVRKTIRMKDLLIN